MARRIRQSGKMRIRLDGVDDVIKALREADEATNEELRILVAEAAEIVFREADSRVPVGESSEMRDSIRIEVGTNKKGFYYANVVVGGNDAYYATFYELGTSRQPPRPFMRPSLDKSKAQIRKLLVDGLKRALDKQGR